jgi:Zn finger protein HypA/HybF involved in hydrogenase expression
MGIPAKAQCLCCGNTLMAQINQRRTYWFCRTCWQEMPMAQGEDGLSVSRMPTKGQTRLGLERSFRAQDAVGLRQAS